MPELRAPTASPRGYITGTDGGKRSGIQSNCPFVGANAKCRRGLVLEAGLRNRADVWSEGGWAFPYDVIALGLCFGSHAGSHIGFGGYYPERLAPRTRPRGCAEGRKRYRRSIVELAKLRCMEAKRQIRLICRHCGAQMRLAREMPWVSRDLAAVQLFQCGDCGHVDMLIARELADVDPIDDAAVEQAVDAILDAAAVRW